MVDRNSRPLRDSLPVSYARLLAAIALARQAASLRGYLHNGWLADRDAAVKFPIDARPKRFELLTPRFVGWWRSLKSLVFVTVSCAIQGPGDGSRLSVRDDLKRIGHARRGWSRHRKKPPAITSHVSGKYAVAWRWNASSQRRAPTGW